MKFTNIFLGILILASIATAQPYRVDWYVVGAGGGQAQSSSYQVDGTIGQPIVGQATSANYRIDAGFWIGSTGPIPCEYMLGDINSNGSVIGADVTYGVRYFKGLGNPPPDSCFNDSVSTLTHWLYVAGDVNASCTFAGSDITRLVSYFKGLSALQYCRFFPPPVLTLSSEPVIIPAMIQQNQSIDVSNPLPLKGK
jgi:hypothetical protein